MLPFTAIPLIRKGGMKNLQKCIDDICQNPQAFLCSKCKQNTSQRIYKVKDVIIIECQYMFHDDDKTITSPCPTSITIDSNTYNIIGLIEILKINERINHYVAHIYFNSNWNVKDEWAKNIRKYTQQSTSMRVSLIIYAKC